MQIFILSIIAYSLIAVTLYIGLQERCKKNLVFQAPSSQGLYYLLSFTWGLPMTLVGCIVALVLIIAGHRPVKYGYGWCFEFPKLGWGLELGLFFISSDKETTKQHELGHGIQNCWLGPFMPVVVSLPSAIRYWYREIQYNRKKKLKPYDSIWFEGSATESGKALMEKLQNKK